MSIRPCRRSIARLRRTSRQTIVADNNFGATATVPVELLQRYYGATPTPPQTSIHRVGYVNLTGKVAATPIWTIEGGHRGQARPSNLVIGDEPGCTSRSSSRSSSGGSRAVRRLFWIAAWLARPPDDYPCDGHGGRPHSSIKFGPRKRIDQASCGTDCSSRESLTDSDAAYRLFWIAQGRAEDQRPSRLSQTVRRGR
jgi:hypothetical protein